jgi:adenylate cyclase
VECGATLGLSPTTAAARRVCEHPGVDRRLTRFLKKQGATKEEIDAAAADGHLTLLVLDRLLVPGEPHLDASEVAVRSGVPEETATKLWRALGFPDIPDGQRAFTDESVEVLRVLNERSASSMFTSGDDLNALVAQVRAIGAGLSRVAESLSDQIVEGVLAARASGLDDETTALTATGALDWQVLARLNDFALRVQVRAAVLRKLLTPQLGSGALPELTVGFVDLVGYTALSQELDGAELNALVARFESVTYDTVAQLGGRLVKTIGDEVMFVAEAPEVALQIALELTDRTRQDEVLPRARAGLACGPALAREGDYYGAMVNLAHRLVEIARPQSIIVSAELAASLEGNEAFTFQRLRSRRIRGIGRVEIYVAGATAVADPTDPTSTRHSEGKFNPS